MRRKKYFRVVAECWDTPSAFGCGDYLHRGGVLWVHKQFEDNLMKEIPSLHRGCGCVVLKSLLSRPHYCLCNLSQVITKDNGDREKIYNSDLKFYKR